MLVGVDFKGCNGHDIDTHFMIQIRHGKRLFGRRREHEEEDRLNVTLRSTSKGVRFLEGKVHRRVGLIVYVRAGWNNSDIWICCVDLLGDFVAYTSLSYLGMRNSEALFTLMLPNELYSEEAE